MINYDSILSAFDGKPTLLQWLKLVKKALDESVLKDITLNQDGANVVFTFNFEDGTSISTPAVTLPKGDTGAKGDKGDKGEQGASVTGVDEVSNEVVGGQTLTTLRFNFSNGTNDEVVVHAENGKSGGKLYRHSLHVYTPNSNLYNLIAISNSSEVIYNEPGTQSSFPTEKFDKMLKKFVNFGYYDGFDDVGTDILAPILDMSKSGNGYTLKYISGNTVKQFVFEPIYISDTVTEL